MKVLGSQLTIFCDCCGKRLIADRIKLCEIVENDDGSITYAAVLCFSCEFPDDATLTQADRCPAVRIEQ